ncbi:hypothetical protein JG688_00002164 [Phytophthora aleatoria]|uniref:Uncharacterized protein n=1 Tax=Phytophthora aleatoria TaxID=2496075 RepID=A0A8J5MAZ8_9STRA|nr:hypothetical protein JG688_00002164 [Phytophthora aleatoria]
MKTATTTVFILTLFVLTEAGYVDLFKDADFKNKRARVKDVVVDVCYTFKCEYGDSLDNSITSAKWHGLPEHGAFFRDGDATINFYTGLDCKGEHESWLIKTQSKEKLYFPENFRLDGINDAISFTCDNLDNAITSAKWHGLPETGSYFEGGDALITFNTGANCDGKDNFWYINTQSKKDKYFPENFRLDGINDDISSFMVLNKGGNAGSM